VSVTKRPPLGWVRERSDDPNFTDKDLIVVGDFNIPNERSDLFAAITRHGLRMPSAPLGPHGSNLTRDKSYDQLHDAKYVESFTNHGEACSTSTAPITGRCSRRRS
jgi:hypothetical protein